jgi:hypothetical protein
VTRDWNVLSCSEIQCSSSIDYFTPGYMYIQMVHWSNSHEGPWGEVSDNKSLWMDFRQSS